MSEEDKLSVAGKTNGVDGWEGTERRKENRRAPNGDAAPNQERRGPDRRRAQHCRVCGKTFHPTPMHKRICPACRTSANASRSWQR
jgi:uncharacterized OB-fold protein